MQVGPVSFIDFVILFIKKDLRSGVKDFQVIRGGLNSSGLGCVKVRLMGLWSDMGWSFVPRLVDGDG